MSEFRIQDGQQFLFIGDSITDCGRRGEGAPFGNGYVKIAIDLITARYPERRIRYRNEGISGNTVADLHARWDADVIAHQPDWLSVKIGINDLHRTLRDAPESLPPDRYEALYREILTRARAETPARLILIDPFYISTATDGFEAEVLRRLDGYLDAVHRLAEEFQAIPVRTHDVFQEQLRYRPATEFCPEPVHPYASGHVVIAHALLRALNW